MAIKKQPYEKKNQTTQLKAIAGIPPQTYVPVGFLIFFLMLGFFLFVYPGMRFYGSRVSFKSAPAGVAVFVNDRLVGSTPVKAKIRAGEYTVRFEKPYFETQEMPINVKGRVLFSMIFPRTQRQNVQMKIDSLPLYLSNQYYQASQWYALPTDSARPKPQLIKETVSALAALSPSITQEHALITQWAISLRDLIQDEQTWQEITLAWKKLSSAPLKLELPSSLDSIRNAASLDDYLKNFANNPEAEKQPIDMTPLPSATLSISGIRFTAAPAGSLTMGQEGENNEYNTHQVDIPAFYYMADYLRASEYLRLTGKATLAVDGPVVGLNYEQVQLAIDAINEALTNMGLSNYEASLPNEAQWQYLATSSRIKAALFEWTCDNYIRYRGIYYAGISDFPQPFASREKVIRGQSVFSGDLPLWYHASFLQDHNSPYISARIVIKRRSP